jgi:hypothetical protein
MNRKLLIKLAPLLAIAAFAVVPAAAQAVPHVYKNGVIGAEGKKVRMISWGNLSTANSTFGTPECHSLWGGYLENPTGGGAAVGQAQTFAFYECVSPTCTGLGGSKFEVITEKLPWADGVTEPEAGVFRLSIGKKGEKGGAGSVELEVNCEGVSKSHPFGNVAPKILNNGLAIGAAPTELEFDAGSGELQSEIGPWTFPGKEKVLGYGSQELIEAKNP